MIKNNWTIWIVRFDSIPLDVSKMKINAVNTENWRVFCVLLSQRCSKWPHQTTCLISGAIKCSNSLQAATLYFRRVYCIILFVLSSLFTIISFSEHNMNHNGFFFISEKERRGTKNCPLYNWVVVELRFAGNKGGWYGNGLNGHFLPVIRAILKY